MRRRLAAAAALAAVASLAISLEAGSTPASYPGANGKIAFARFSPDTDSDIFVMSPTGGKQVRLMGHRGTDGEPSWSADGRKIVFTNSLASGVQGLFVANADGSGVRRLTRNVSPPDAPILDAHPRWSPDGRWIVFHRYRRSGSEILLVRADGSGMRTLGAGFEPSWSPDGAQIAFAHQTSALADYDIYVMNTDGSRRRRLTRTRTSDMNPDWSPNGKWIVLERKLGQNFDVFVITADGGRGWRVTKHPEADVDPSWSPDGKRILFASRRVFGRFDVFSAASDGSRLTRLTNDPADDAQPHWQPLPKRR